MKTFTANDKAWKTDDSTLKLMQSYRDARNKYMLSLVFKLGVAFGRIKEIPS